MQIRNQGQINILEAGKIPPTRQAGRKNTGDHGLIVVIQLRNMLRPGIIEKIHIIQLGHTL
jgi:hypothetical protein